MDGVTGRLHGRGRAPLEAQRAFPHRAEHHEHRRGQEVELLGRDHLAQEKRIQRTGHDA